MWIVFLLCHFIHARGYERIAAFVEYGERAADAEASV
jgi:hypothetical protein